MFKKIALILILCCSVVVDMSAQYYSINFDEATVAMMTGVFGAQAGIESYYTQQTDKILEHYEAAGVASAGIFASKFLDRKALTKLGGWSSATENYYYKRIYNMVSRKIIPKMWDCATIMLRDPSTAIHWGSYLLKTCDEVKSLCQQFESVVTNGRLSFADIAFLEINENIKNVFKLSELGGVNWENTFDHFSDGVSLTINDLQTDVTTLYNMGVGLATSGWQGAVEGTLNSSAFKNTAMQKVNTITQLATQYKTLFDSSDGNIGNMVLSLVGDNMDNLFATGNYNNSLWQSDYANISDKRYYKQRWYLYSVDQGSVDLCNYTPPTDDNSILYGDHWYRIDTTDPNYYPDSGQREAALQNSEAHAGWSRSKVQQMNNSHDGYSYNINYWSSAYILSRSKSGQYAKAYAYEIHVTKSWYWKMEAYEEEFDSYNMDLNTFKKQLQVKLDELNRNEEGIRYYMGNDSQRYYTATDAGKLKGAETATISISCNGGANMGEGSTQYKCSSCGGSVSNHTKSCVMNTSLTDNSIDTKELDDNINRLNGEINAINSQITSLQQQQSDLLSKMRSCTSEEYIEYRSQYNNVTQQIDTLKSQKQSKESERDQYQRAKEEAVQGESVQTDDWYRIPAIMNDIKNAYKLQWNNDGRWEGNTYVRTATMTGINGVITFRADVSIARSPKYFLGIKIHRAIVRIAWKLTTEYGDTEVVEVVNLDPNKSDQRKADEVNARIRAVQNDYPDCEVSVQYNKAEGGETDDTDDTYHLLWSSDRLTIAREIDTRLNKIYASLVCYEKMMHYKYSIVDYLKSQLPGIRNDQGRRFNLVQRCKRRWLRNAAINSGQDYDGRYDTDEDE